MISPEGARSRSKSYFISTGIIITLLVVMQIILPLFLVKQSGDNPLYQVLSMLLYWIGIPLAAATLTTAFILRELGRAIVEK